MSHAVFQTAQIMPMNTQVRTKTLSPKPSLTKPSLPTPKLGPLKPVIKPAAVKLRRRGLVVKAWSPAEVGNDSASLLERCFVAPPAPGSRDSSSPPSSSPPSSSASLSPIMKGGEYGAFGTVTLEKSKLDTTQKQTRSSSEVSSWLCDWRDYVSWFDFNSRNLMVNLEIKKLTEEKKDALAAQYAAEATLEAEIKMYKNEITALQKDKQALEQLTKSKESALLEAKRIL